MTNEEQFHLFDAIDGIPELQGAGVGYVGDGQCKVLRQTQHISGFDTWIILETMETPNDGVLAVAQKAPSPKPTFFKDLLSAGINCCSAVLTGAATATEAAAAPVTGGGSLALAYITGAGALATSLQCGLSVGRIVDYFIDPDLTAYLDSDDWYNSANDLLDYIAIAGAAASLGQAAQGLIRLQKASGKPFKEMLKGMSRAERKRLARELAEYAGTKSNQQFKALVRAGKLPSIYSQKSVDLALRKMVLDGVSSALTYAGSATSGVIREKYLVYIVQEN